MVMNGEDMCDALANGSFKVSKLIWHQKTKHSSLANRGTELIKRKAEIVKPARLDTCGSYRQK
jgi:hypothetical protein